MTSKSTFLKKIILLSAFFQVSLQCPRCHLEHLLHCARPPWHPHWSKPSLAVPVSRTAKCPRPSGQSAWLGSDRPAQSVTPCCPPVTRHQSDRVASGLSEWAVPPVSKLRGNVLISFRIRASVYCKLTFKTLSPHDRSNVRLVSAYDGRTRDAPAAAGAVRVLPAPGYGARWHWHRCSI